MDDDDFDLGGQPLTDEEKKEYDFSDEAARTLRSKFREIDEAQGAARLFARSSYVG